MIAAHRAAIQDQCATTCVRNATTALHGCVSRHGGVVECHGGVVGDPATVASRVIGHDGVVHGDQATRPAVEDSCTVAGADSGQQTTVLEGDPRDRHRPAYDVNDAIEMVAVDDRASSTDSGEREV